MGNEIPKVHMDTLNSSHISRNDTNADKVNVHKNPVNMDAQGLESKVPSNDIERKEVHGSSYDATIPYETAVLTLCEENEEVDNFLDELSTAIHLKDKMFLMINKHTRKIRLLHLKLNHCQSKQLLNLRIDKLLYQ